MDSIYRFVVVVLNFICFIRLPTFPGWHEGVNQSGSDVEIRPFPSRPATATCLLAMGLAFGFGLVSIFWQHINSISTALIAETLTYGAVSGHVRGTSMALGWITVALIGCVGLGLLFMKLSIDHVTGLTDDE